MKTLTINKLRVGSFAKVVGIYQAVIGFIAGVVISFSVFADSVTASTSWVKSLGVSVFTLGMSIIFLPLIGYVVGWVQGAVVALILNFVFKESNGLEIEIEESK